MKTDDNRCRSCGIKLIGKNAISVGYCIPCYAMLMADPDDGVDEFQTCANCSTYDICSNLGCAMKSHLGRNLLRQ